MTELENAFRSILTDPCNRGAERRNWSNVRNVLEIINNTIINEGDTTIAQGDTLVLFEVTSDAFGLPSAPVQQLLWDGSTWVRNGDAFTAYDWSTSGKFRANFLLGMQGVGVKRRISQRMHWRSSPWRDWRVSVKWSSPPSSRRDLLRQRSLNHGVRIPTVLILERRSRSTIARARVRIS